MKYYPCHYCGDTSLVEFRKHPPQTKTRKEFAFWMCNLHNEVNDRLGKPIFDCNNLSQRWRRGWDDGRCGKKKGVKKVT